LTLERSVSNVNGHWLLSTLPEASVRRQLTPNSEKVKT